MAGRKLIALCLIAAALLLAACDTTGGSPQPTSEGAEPTAAPAENSYPSPQSEGEPAGYPTPEEMQSQDVYPEATP